MAAIVRVDGLKELDAQLERLKPATGKAALRKGLKKAADPLAEIMRALAPNDPETGGYDLQKSIASSSRLSHRQKGRHKKIVRDDKASVEWFVGAGPLPQAHLLEFGTFKITPRSFARSAWDQDQAALLERIKGELTTSIMSAIGRAGKRGTLIG